MNVKGKNDNRNTTCLIRIIKETRMKLLPNDVSKGKSKTIM